MYRAFSSRAPGDVFKLICPRVGHFGAQQTMAVCVVIGCSNRSDRNKRVSFHRLFAVTSHNGEREFELPVKRRAALLAAISPEDLEALRFQ